MAENYIFYLRDDNQVLLMSKKDNIYACVIGGTKYPELKINEYKLILNTRIQFKCYYKIDKDCYLVEKQLTNLYNPIRRNFFDSEKLTPAMLEDFFYKNNVNFQKFTDVVIRDITNEEIKIVQDEKMSVFNMNQLGDN